MAADSPRSIEHRAFLESTPLVPWEVDLESGRMLYVGPQAVAFLGHSLSEWIEPTFWVDRVLPDDQTAVLAARAELIAQGESRSHVIEYRMEHADGHLIWVSEIANTVSVEGRVVGLRGLLSDITDRRRLEASLAQSEERLRALLRGAPDAMILTTDDGIILNVNDQAEYLFDYPAEEIVGSAVRHLVPERLVGRLDGLREAFDRDPARRSLVDGHGFLVLRRDGEEVPIELSISPVPVVGGRQFLYSARDVTARTRIEAQLRSSQHRLRGMADALPAMVSFVDAEQRYRMVNANYAAWAGWEPVKMEGRLVREVLGETLYANQRPAIEAALAGTPGHFQFTVVGSDQEEHAVDINYVPHWDGDEVTGYFVVVMDISKQVARATAAALPTIDSRTPAMD